MRRRERYAYGTRCTRTFFFSEDVAMWFGLCAPGPGTSLGLLFGRCDEPDLKAELCTFDILLKDLSCFPNVDAGRYEPGPGVASPR